MSRSAPRILLVEDEPEVREYISMALKEEGHQVIAVGTAGEAFEHLCMGLPFTLLITDVRIPGAVDGKMFAGVAADLRPGLPILVISGYPEPQAGELPPRARVRKKPFTADYLLGQVTECSQSKDQPAPESASTPAGAKRYIAVGRRSSRRSHGSFSLIQINEWALFQSWRI